MSEGVRGFSAAANDANLLNSFDALIVSHPNAVDVALPCAHPALDDLPVFDLTATDASPFDCLPATAVSSIVLPISPSAHRLAQADGGRIPPCRAKGGVEEEPLSSQNLYQTTMSGGSGGARASAIRFPLLIANPVLLPRSSHALAMVIAHNGGLHVRQSAAHSLADYLKGPCPTSDVAMTKNHRKKLQTEVDLLITALLNDSVERLLTMAASFPGCFTELSSLRQMFCSMEPDVGEERDAACDADGFDDFDDTDDFADDAEHMM